MHIVFDNNNILFFDNNNTLISKSEFWGPIPKHLIPTKSGYQYRFGQKVFSIDSIMPSSKRKILIHDDDFESFTFNDTLAFKYNRQRGKIAFHNLLNHAVFYDPLPLSLWVTFSEVYVLAKSGAILLLMYSGSGPYNLHIRFYTIESMSPFIISKREKTFPKVRKLPLYQDYLTTDNLINISISADGDNLIYLSLDDDFTLITKPKADSYLILERTETTIYMYKEMSLYSLPTTKMGQHPTICSSDFKFIYFIPYLYPRRYIVSYNDRIYFIDNLSDVYEQKVDNNSHSALQYDIILKDGSPAFKISRIRVSKLYYIIVEDFHLPDYIVFISDNKCELSYHGYNLCLSYTCHLKATNNHPLDLKTFDTRYSYFFDGTKFYKCVPQSVFQENCTVSNMIAVSYNSNWKILNEYYVPNLADRNIIDSDTNYVFTAIGLR